jgi:protein-disulfide isomerase/uncharacterized membrane protein YphA (DoxX/SURF4 family)
MPGVLLGVRLVLAAVLAVAGVAKLGDRAGAREAVTGFGLPEMLAPAAAALLPLVELAAAVLLIPSATAPAGSVLALALMVAFSAAIARNVARGEAPDCHCFGALHSEPAGPRALIRNLAPAAAAAVALAGGPGTSATRWIADLSDGWLTALLFGVALAAALAGGSSFALRLLRRNGQLLLQIDTLEEALTTGGVALPSALPVPAAGLPVGAETPEFELEDLAGGRVGLASLREALGDLLLVFSDPECGPCSALMPQVAAWQREHPGGLRPVLVSRGAHGANGAHAREHGLTDVLLQQDREVSESFLVDATPAAVIVAGDGTIASAVHTGEEQIRALVASRSEVELRVHRHRPAVGRPAPDPALLTLTGEPARLSSALSNGTTAVVFWNPACGFCERMVEQLRAIDASTSPGSPGLVVISTGDPEANRAIGLRAPILLDDAFVAGTAFGAAGTPSALLVDERGRVASAVAVGADAVLALVGADSAAVAA